MKRPLLFLLFFFMSTGRLFALDQRIIRISGPPVAESLPFAMISGMELSDPSSKILFIPWHSPDQMRAMIAGGQVDGAIVTTAAASLFYHKGVPTKMAALFETPLWIVSSADVHNKRLDELTGVVLFPFGPKEMPELLFDALRGRHHPEITRHHTGGALETVNLLLLNRGEHALLCEPSASLAVIRSQAMQEKGVPRLAKQLDLRELWRERFNGRRLFVSGFAIFGNTLNDSAILECLLEEYERAVAHIAAHPEEVLAIAQKRFPALAAQSEGGTLPGVDIRLNTGKKACSDARFFLRQLSEQAPRAIGGKIPGDDFFVVRR